MINKNFFIFSFSLLWLIVFFLSYIFWTNTTPPLFSDYENWEYWKGFWINDFYLLPFVINPLQGMFGYSLPVNSSFDLIFWLAELFPYKDKFFISKCLILTFESFSLFFLCKQLKMNDLGILVVFILNFFLFNSLFNQSEWSLYIFEDLLGVSILKTYCILIFGIFISSSEKLTNFHKFSSILFFALGFLLNPSYFLIYLGLPILFLITFYISNSPDRFIFKKYYFQLISISIFILLLALVYFIFSGISARNIFGNEIVTEVQTIDYLNTVFFRNSPYSLLLSFLIILSSLSLVLRGRNKEGSEYKAYGISSLLIMITLLLIGIFYTFSGVVWKYPSPVYFEQTIYPCLICSIGLAVNKRNLFLTFFLIFLSALLVYKVSKPRQEDIKSFLYQEPQEKIEINKNNDLIPFLNSNISLEGNFRGTIAQIFPLNGDIYLDEILDSELLKTKAYTRIKPYKLFEIIEEPINLTTLWKNNIPTLEDNNHLISPYKYYFFSRHLSRPEDFQQRNFLFSSKTDDNILKMLGVKFLLTDEKKSLKVLKKYSKNLLNIYLYEYEDTNLANFYFEKIKLFEDAEDFEKLSLKEGIDFKNFLYIHKDDIFKEQLDLVKGITTKFIIKKDRIIIKASSKGHSMLLLPVEYRNAYKIKGTSAKLFRANIFMTGVFFDKDLDIEIMLYPSSLQVLLGILDDIKDLKKFNFNSGLVNYPLEYQPYKILYFQ